VRSRFTVNFLTDAGKFFRWFSPAAGALDSISVWIITLAAPLVGVALLSRAWPGVNDAVWGAIEIAIAAGAYRMCSAAADASSEVAHLEGVAALVWGTFGAIAVAQALVIPSFVEHGTMALGIVAIAAILAVTASEQPRFVAMVAAGTLMAGLAILVVLFNEAEFANLPSTLLHQDHLEVALTIAELLAVGAGVVAWLDMRRRNANANVANALILMCYAALMLVDARVLGEIWRPLVTASFAIAGTIMLFISRKGDNKVVRAVGAATLILVTFRLFFVDMQGVDTIWRVLLFLGVGALFLFTSRQLQAGRKTAVSEST
jgi:uncharacterized membrane protein